MINVHTPESMLLLMAMRDFVTHHEVAEAMRDVTQLDRAELVAALRDGLDPYDSATMLERLLLDGPTRAALDKQIGQEEMSTMTKQVQTLKRKLTH